MRRPILLFLALLFGLPAVAQRAPHPEGAVELAYGDHERQRLDYTPAGRDAPLVVFIHGGGWSFGDKRIAGHMAAHFHRRGYAFASLNYRLVPEVNPAGQAEDVAAAVARLLREAGPRQVMMIGHSAGAHLAALVGTDPVYLAAHRLPISTVAGVVLLDGAGYDVPAQMARGGPFVRRMYRSAFTDDPAFQRRVSPATHAAAPNAGRFLILHIASRPNDSGAQSERLGEALRAAGTPADVAPVDGTHAAIFASSAGRATPPRRARTPLPGRCLGANAAREGRQREPARIYRRRPRPGRSSAPR